MGMDSNTTSSSCEYCKDHIDRLIQQITGLEQELHKKTTQIEQLKQKNTQEKKRHTEINKEIIMSNVRFQQALNQAQNITHRVIREKEELLKKEVSVATLKAENDTLRTTNSQLFLRLDTLNLKLPAKESQKPLSVTTPKNQISKGLHERTPSELNSAAYVAKHAKGKKDAATEIVRMPTMEATELDDSTIESTELNTSLNTSQERPEHERRYRLRESGGHKAYTEPSLRTKLRRGDNYSFIIPEFVVCSDAKPVRTPEKSDKVSASDPN